jgi:hypothetical protein
MNSRLTATTLRFHLNYDPATGLFYRRLAGNTYKPGDLAGGRQTTGYISISVCGKMYYAHRLAWLYMLGEWPATQLDHKNQDCSDNRWDNLRVATHAQNNQNKPARVDNKSGAVGVSWRKSHKLWQARITVAGRDIHLGYFPRKEEAIAVRVIAAAKYHGEFATQD